MKVLFVYDIYYSYGGGSQVISLNWFELLNRSGIETYYLTNDLIKRQKIPFESKVIINKFDLTIKKPFPQFKIPLLIEPKILNLILKNQFDIIQFFEPSLIGLEILFLKKFLKKFIKSKFVFYYITIFRNPDKQFNIFDKTMLNIASSLQKIFIDLVDGIIFPSHFIKEVLKEEFKNQKLKIIYPPIKNSFYNKNFEIKSKEPRELLIVSRLTKGKGIEIPFYALKLLRSRFKLNIIGDGKDRNYYEKLAKKLGIENQVVFWGWVENKELPRLLKNFDIFIFPSSTETFGLAQIEALASGLPLITLDNKLNREIIPKEMAIFLKDFNPQNLANCLLKIQKNKNLYLELQKNIKRNYSKLYKYHEENTIKNLIDFYNNLI